MAGFYYDDAAGLGGNNSGTGAGPFAVFTADGIDIDVYFRNGTNTYALFNVHGSSSFDRGNMDYNVSGDVAVVRRVQLIHNAQVALSVQDINVPVTSFGSDQAVWDLSGVYDGDDIFDGNAYSDVWYGGLGNDWLTGHDGDDRLLGQEGLDHLDGGNGNDFLSGGGGNDRFAGGFGWDTLAGGSGADSLNAQGGNDLLVGGAGNDSLYGGAGNDILRAQEGRDELTGGTGSDAFLFDAAVASGNVDVVTDFLHGTDRIRLAERVFTAFDAITKSTLDDTQFYKAPGAVAAHDADDRIVYNSSTGELFHDADGFGGVAAVKFAVIGATTHPSGITAADFLIVA